MGGGDILTGGFCGREGEMDKHKDNAREWVGKTSLNGMTEKRCIFLSLRGRGPKS